jgi:hypothetical protein
MPIEVKPCPFCGSPPLVDQGFGLATCSRVGCAARGVVLLDDWNTRLVEDELRVKLEGYRKALDVAMDAIGMHFTAYEVEKTIKPGIEKILESYGCQSQP